MAHVHELMISALKTANDAINMDNSGNYASAVQLYEDVIAILESDDILSAISSADQAKATEIAGWYADRIDNIVATVPELLSKNSIPEWNYFEVPVNYSV